ncbi:hypothetical protein BAE44_0009206 [Dichanthelium oligosanthes]|uniref:Uncharacterized protein n=1 Tax=Dichanthelium oligosanthes TaxID=888268 RepID=A0A1E5VXE2_9POAL|nr:hypothetical protein BAE44_0009206 [Dichanthelium oligosanthes]
MASVAVDHQMDIAPAAEAAEDTGGAAVRQRRGWLRRMYSPVGVAEQGAEATAVDAANDDGGAGRRKPRRGGALGRLVPMEHALRRRWKMLRSTLSRLAAGLRRGKRVPAGLSAGGGWASALLDAAAFRVMYVVEAVVLGLALSCFFCCCGCQI